jgi:hypothetical protein
MKLHPRLLFVALGIWSMSALADSPAHVGTWTKNLAESINMPDPTYRETVVIRRAGPVLDFTWTGVSADGKKDTFSFTGKVDGKEAPLPGSTPITGKLTQTLDGVTESVLKFQDGSTEDKMCILTSSDRMTCYATVTDAAGKKSIFKEVFDREKVSH